LAHLGYAAARDHAIEQEQARLAKASADREHRFQSKAAWQKALGIEEGQTKNLKVGTDLVFKLDEWLKQKPEAMGAKILQSDSVYVKSFNLSDVEWHNERTARIRGYLVVTFEGQIGGSESVFNWTRDMEYQSDGVDSWWSAEGPVFTYTGPGNKKLDKQPIVILALKSTYRTIERNR
jgi:hypothetical protein